MSVALIEQGRRSGKQRSGRTNPSYPWLADALVPAAWAASRSKNTWPAARSWRLARRMGKKKALIAIAHSMVLALWHTRRCRLTLGYARPSRAVDGR
jgi:hypothetical protein